MCASFFVVCLLSAVTTINIFFFFFNHISLMRGTDTRTTHTHTRIYVQHSSFYHFLINFISFQCVIYYCYFFAFAVAAAALETSLFHSRRTRVFVMCQREKEKSFSIFLLKAYSEKNHLLNI